MLQTAYLALILEAYLTNCHTAIFLEIGPRRVNDSDVVLLIALHGCQYIFNAAEVNS